MGLIAVVYRAKENLPFDMEKEGAEVDVRTGAIYFTDPEKKKVHPREERQAVRIKLGTSHEIVEVSKELGPMLGAAESVLTDRVLYDYSHSGDIVEQSELIPLDVELQSAKDRLGSRASKITAKFLEDMSVLVRAAQEQRNPIVFV
ncbi:hypothetical protein Acid345_1836 [Candidatus Koribacter versatilis Ellin345]|uniref:Uncharacterized protein n=1 Tax=Koribacter versatilis (strain Ellin345) TaxID=204669 RepID=Q1IQL3_KORVE|nr:hypothetical protein [Candidatus Koribacter versatilis]ABF40837.1 hypothetical protein Acid345_1836 [Candidatus Koribacter versatilis Ellin345]